jgi:hypothetical protein
MRGAYCDSRLVVRVADHLVLGPRIEPDAQETIHLFNNTESDLIACVMQDGEIISKHTIYPLVIAYVPRPTDTQVIRLSIDGKEVDLARDKFRRKMNVVELATVPDLSVCMSTYKIWHGNILSMSDKIVIADDVTIHYKDPADVGSNVFFKFVSAVFIYELLLIIIVISCFMVFKCLFSTTYGQI